MQSKPEKLKYINELQKEEKIHDLLDELLPEMGFLDVTVTHERGNNPENGKDLICSELDEIEDKKDWYAFVVKKGVVAGTSSVINDIQSQVNDCFTYEYKNLVTTNERVRINKVKVVTNGHFSTGATQKILTNNNFDKANISFWDGEKLIDLLDKYYPRYWLKGSKSYKQYVERFELRISTDDFSKTLNLNSTRTEKFSEFGIKQRLVEKIKKDDGSFSTKFIDCNSVIDISENTIIVAQPGGGKSSLFKKLAKDIILQNSLRNNEDFYPILFTFRDLAKSNFSIEKTLKDHFNLDWTSDLKIDSQEIIEKNGCVIFIDALDEIGEVDLKEKALGAIKNFMLQHPEIKILCSSRPSDFVLDNGTNHGFKILEIPDLNLKQIKEFIDGYFTENIQKSKRLLQSLKDTGLLEKLPKTPLTLALVTILFDEKEIEIPATLSDLYKYFVDLLIGRTEIEKTTDIIEIGIKHRLLCHIAKTLHKDNEQLISYKILTDVVTKYSQDRGQDFDVNKVIEDLVDKTGLLFVNEKKEVQFKHLSFQEYFTAYEYFNHRHSESEILSKKFNEVWWQNVGLFYAGMSKDSPEFLEKVLEQSIPNAFYGQILSIGGIGKLVQALYNTPQKNRISATEFSLQNTLSAIDYLINTNDDKEKGWKAFSAYGLYMIIGGWFQSNFSSITLVTPLKKHFEKLFSTINNKLSDDDRFNLEFKLFLVSGILASPSYLEFKEYKLLVENRRSTNLSLIAAIDTHFRNTLKALEKSQITDDVEKINKRLDILRENLRGMENIVNTPIKDTNKKIKAKLHPPTIAPGS